MRIKIVKLVVKETHHFTENLNRFTIAWRYLFGPQIELQYHFDVLIKVDDEYLSRHNRLERNQFVQLPNKVRLMIWQVDRNIIRAKTYKWVDEDLRQYHPIEMFLIYEKQHGHLADKFLTL